MSVYATFDFMLTWLLMLIMLDMRSIAKATEKLADEKPEQPTPPPAPTPPPPAPTQPQPPAETSVLLALVYCAAGGFLAIFVIRALEQLIHLL
jgi:hypothetical protein